MTTVPPSRGVDADRILEQPLFASLTRPEAEEFVRYCEVRHVEPGHPVFTQGGLAAAFFVIESGEASVLVNGRKKATLKPGDYFGEVALIDAGTRSWARGCGRRRRVPSCGGSAAVRLRPRS